MQLIKQKQFGFSLLEILTGCLLVVILSSIAYPSYQYLLRRNHRAIIKLHLQELNLDLLQQQIYKLNKTEISQYNTKYYVIKLHKQNKGTLISATPLGMQRKDSCQTLRLWTNNEHKPQPDNCWN